MSAESPFCDTCQRNQLLLNKTLAEYIPDEDDPEYDKYAASVDDYRAELEERYPQVCENCIERVQAQIRAAGYAAKADHLRRILEQSTKARGDAYTPRQFWTLCIISLAEWTYIVSVLVGLIWHAFGTIVAPDAGMFEDGDFSWRICLQKAVMVREVDQSCLRSPYILQLVKYALIADLLTIWWNPKLKQKTNRAGGRMRGLHLVWCVRIAVLAVRYLSFRSFGAIEMEQRDHPQRFHYTHGIIFAILLLSTIVGWNSVRIVYPSTASLKKPLDSHLPSAPNSAEKARRSGPTSVLPNSSSFDTMAQSFTSSFLAEPSTNYPPSPTLSAVSSATHDSETSTPYMRRPSTRGGDDAMDWTPTQKRFASNTPSILPPQWLPSSPLPQPTPTRQQHSIFSKPDPNPFRHKIPAAPKAPAQAKANPWNPGVWAPPLKATTTNFFKDNRKGEEHGDRGLQGIGVPKNIQKDAEMFQAPKLKYDYYGKLKETGLESSFNDLFSK